MNEYDVRGSLWFTGGQGTVGIVRVMTEYDGIQYFIGIAEGLDREADEQAIAAWGARASYPVVAHFLTGS